MNEAFMREAIDLSIQKMNGWCGGPFGAVVVKDGKIISRGWNRVTSTNDPTAHAEIAAIREACSKLDTFDLSGCELYASCEPCPMCLSAIYWARIDRLYYAANSEDAADAGFDDAHIHQELCKPETERQIPVEQVMRSEAQKAFELWKNKADKIHY